MTRRKRRSHRRELRAEHLGLGLMVLAASAALARAEAQTAGPSASQASPSQAPSSHAPSGSANGAPSGGAEADEDEPVDATVEVRARKVVPLPGAVVGDIKPEISFTPQDIQSFGVSTVTELLTELAPETRSDRGRSQQPPVVLLNGRRISALNEIQNIPTEAILRVDVLPEEVSLKYGYTADQRVVNIVLRRRFHAITGEVAGGAATEGGALAGTGELDKFEVRGDNRLNLDLKISDTQPLTEAQRGIVSSPGAFTPGGQVVGLLPNGEIDPGLSALAGQTTLTAALPERGPGQPPSLAAFLPGAVAPGGADAGDFRTLTDLSQAITANGVLARPGPLGSQLTLNATLGATRTLSLQGLYDTTLTVPAGDPFSPFAEAVDVDRGEGPLVQTVEGWTAHLGVTDNKDFSDWRLSLTGAYDHADSATATGSGYLTSILQSELNALSPDFDPFAPLPPGSEPPLDQNTARALSDAANIQLLGNGPLLTLPTGDLYFSGKIGDTITLFDSTSEFDGAFQATSLTRNDFNTQLNFDLPVAGGPKQILRPLGDLSFNLNTAVDVLSDFGTLPTVGYGLNWTPAPGYNLIVSVTRDHQAPTPQQLFGPVVLTPEVRLYDFGAGETVDVTQITGGNPNLKADTRQVFKAGLTLRPWAREEFTFTANYLDSRIHNAIGGLPAATAALEAALPGRFIRSEGGALEEEDDRPLNFDEQDRQELRWGFNYARPIGPQPPPRPNLARYRRREAEGEGGRGGGGGGGGGFGRGGGRRGFDPGRYAGGGRLQIAVYHTVYFKDQALLTSGGPLLNYINGAPVGNTGGQYRQEVEGQLGVTLFGFGARVSADWRSATRVVGGSSGDLSFSGITTINFRLFENFAQQPWAIRKLPWLRGARLTLNVLNLFDQRIDVRDSTGPTPLIYDSAYLSPTGRSFTLGVRKLFY